MPCLKFPLIPSFVKEGRVLSSAGGNLPLYPPPEGDRVLSPLAGVVVKHLSSLSPAGGGQGVVLYHQNPSKSPFIKGRLNEIEIFHAFVVCLMRA